MAMSFCALLSASSDDALDAAKRHRRTKPATDSMSESAPKPMRAMELAASPAPTAMAASMPCHPTPSQASCFALRTSRARSEDLWGLLPSCIGGCSRAHPRPLTQDGLEEGGEEGGPLVREGVHNELPIPTRGHQPVRTQQPQVVRDEVLRAPRDPGEVAHAQLLPFAQRLGQGEARGIG